MGTQKTHSQVAPKELIKKERVITNKRMMITRTILEEVEGTTQELCKAFHAMLPTLHWHVMVLKQQWRAYHFIRTSETSTTIVVDFSENFIIEQRRSIQSANFGVSNNQISLHTGVANTSTVPPQDPSAQYLMIRAMILLPYGRILRQL